MAVVAMQKVAVLAHKSKQEDVLKLLQECGVMEIAEGSGAQDVDHTQVAYEKGELAFVKTMLLPHATKDVMENMQRHREDTEIEQMALNVDFHELVDRLKQIEDEQQKLVTMRAEVEKTQDALRPWRHLPYDQTALAEGTQWVEMIIGSLPEDQFKALKLVLQNDLPRSELLQVPGMHGTRIPVVAHVWRTDRKTFDEIATSHGWTTEDMTAQESRPVATILDECNTTLKEIEQRTEVIHKEVIVLSKELPKIACLETYINWLDEKQRAREAMLLSRDTITLLGWIPRSEVALLELKLHQLSHATALLKVKPEDDEEPPVLIRNSKIMTPFESVTTLYGLPLPSEMDPTAPLSLFFIVFFGLCLTDAGYGGTLALIMGLIIWRLKCSVRQQPLIWLLLMSGIVTVVVSIPFGGWFGMLPEQAPDFLTYTNTRGERLFLGQIWNMGTPSGISFFQNLAIALGLMHISFGIFLAGYHKWIHGQKAAALWLDFTSHLLMISVLLRFLAPVSVQPVVQWLPLTAVALFVWGKGYGHPWFLRPIFGVLGAANFAIGLLSNTLSYLRLLALGLVTGAIALAVNQVAIEMSKLFPMWLAIPVLILILIGGHSVSIALNVLGAFIHSGRLQFIEFFSQFFEGGGRVFRPFKRSLSPT